MKTFSVTFKASIGDKVIHKLTGFVGVVTMAGLNEQGDQQFYCENAEGRNQWITGVNLEAAPEK